MKYRFFFLAMFFTSSLISKGQNQMLIGSWIKTKVELFNGDKDAMTSIMDSLFMRFTFKEGGLAFKSITRDQKMRMNYNVIDDIIEWNNEKTKIEKITRDSLILVELENGKIRKNSRRMYFTREEALMNASVTRQGDYYISRTDTIYFQTNRVYPVFDNDLYDLVPYIQRNTEPYDGSGFGYATVIIDEFGKLSEVTVQHHINKLYDESLKKAIINTQGFWIPPTVHGKRVKVLADVKINYQGQPIRKNTQNGFSLTYNCKMCSNEYQSRFIKAIKYLIKNDAEKAVTELADGLAYTDDDANLNYQGSICFEKLKDIPNRDICLDKVRNSKLHYLIEK